VTGGIAAYKAAILARMLTGAGAEVTCVLTEAATRFVGPATFSSLTGRPAYTSLWELPGEVLHVRLAHEVELAVVAPCTANVLAKLANGLSDDLLTATLLEFDGPIVIAPAMHAGMWANDATRANVRTLAERGIRFAGPVEGPLAHGDEGMGRMSEPAEILDATLAAARGDRLQTTTRSWDDLAGARIVVTAGPTHEPIDPVRFVGNRSTGKMGMAIASEAHARGAHVTLVLGPGTVEAPVGIEVVKIETADDLRREVLARFDAADIVVMAAAVADFRPKEIADTKLKKDQGPPELEFEPTPDILAELGERKRAGQLLVGFAAETGEPEAAGREKLNRKGADLLIANVVGREGTGFGSDTNEATIISADGDDLPLQTWTKPELASALCDRLAALRSR
jgi:phosphopantothenoylcysteine decarboxylase/phosphopantothenate--cysteine ligase